MHNNMVDELELRLAQLFPEEFTERFGKTIMVEITDKDILKQIEEKLTRNLEYISEFRETDRKNIEEKFKNSRWLRFLNYFNIVNKQEQFERSAWYGCATERTCLDILNRLENNSKLLLTIDECDREIPIADLKNKGKKILVKNN